VKNERRAAAAAATRKPNALAAAALAGKRRVRCRAWRSEGGRPRNAEPQVKWHCGGGNGQLAIVKTWPNDVP